MVKILFSVVAMLGACTIALNSSIVATAAVPNQNSTAVAAKDSAGVAKVQKYGMKKASKSQAKRMMKDLDFTNVKRKCLIVEVTRSSNKWGYLTYKSYSDAPAGCNPGDYWSINKFFDGKWSRIPLANNASCEDITRELKTKGASKKVIRDFLKDKPCV